jgi:RNase P/RNase MRP subunit p29
MHVPHRSLGLLVVIILMGFGLAGCKSGTVQHSSGSGKSGGREVRFAVEGAGGIVMTQDAATVTFPAGKVIVEKARVLVNDQEVAKVPEETKVVAVDYTGGTLTITADGTKVHEAKHSK